MIIRHCPDCNIVIDCENQSEYQICDCGWSGNTSEMPTEVIKDKDDWYNEMMDKYVL